MYDDVKKAHSRPKRRVRDLESALREIAAAALFLSERPRSRIPRHMYRVTSSSTIRQRLGRWRQAAALGGETRFLRRLRWDGLAVEALSKIVADVNPAEIRVLPEWSQTLRAIIQTVPDFVLQSTRGFPDSTSTHGGPRPFQDLLFPIVAVARMRLSANLQARRNGCPDAPLNLLSQAAYSSLELSLLDRLVFVSSATLYTEFAKRRPAGQTVLMMFGLGTGGKRSKRSYRAFVNDMLRDGLMRLFQTYPVLARLVCLLVDLWVESTAEFLHRLDADYTAVARFLANQSGALGLGKVVSIEPDLSDPHHGGRSVNALIFEDGLKVVYKPKDVGSEAAYAKFVEWCNQHGARMRMKAPSVLTRNGYGWVEYIEHRHCANGRQIQRYYYRAGMQLCLLYLLGAIDCHAENFIANGEHPVLVDAETLMPAEPFAIGEHADPFDSVLRTGLLPRWECHHDTLQALDLSGLGFVGPQRSYDKGWRFVNTDNMYAAWESQEVPIPKNVPLFKGSAKSPSEYIDELTRGFEETYRFLRARRDLLQALGSPLRAFRHQRMRFIFRPTSFYFHILQESLAPEYLCNGVNWSIELEQVAFAFLGTPKKPKAWPILRAEIRFLERLDVPHFTSTAQDSLLMGLGRPLKTYIRAGGFEQLLMRLKRLDDRDLKCQREIIQATIYAQDAQPHTKDEVSSGNIAQRKDHVKKAMTLFLSADAFIREALAVGRCLSDRAVELESGRANWVGLTQMSDAGRFQVNLLPVNLYDGLGGVAIFLAALGSVTGINQFCDLAIRALQPIRRIFRHPSKEAVRRTIRDFGVGGALGLGSVLYAFTTVGRFLDDEALLAEAVRGASGLTIGDIRNDTRLDIMQGVAGTALGLLNLYAATREPSALKKAMACGDHLVRRQIRRGAYRGAWRTLDSTVPLTGFSHGAAGIAYALIRLSAITRGETYSEAALRGFAFERRLFTSAGRQDPDFSARSYPSGIDGSIVGWCHGAPGIALARLGALATVSSDEIRREATLALRATEEYGAQGWDHLCCGNCGRIDTLLVAAKMLGSRRFVDIARMWGSLIIARAKRLGDQESRFALPCARFTNPSLFHGVAGIGYELLRLAQPDSVPSLLLWE